MDGRLIDSPMKHLKWVELDRSAPDWNLRQLRGCSPESSGTLFCAVVKANAYGHGIREIAGLIPSADWLAVNSLEEGLELRRMGEERPVILLGHVQLDRLGEALQAGLRLTVYNFETLDRLRGLPTGELGARIHVKVETGTGRQGILTADLEAFTRMALSIPGVDIEGVSTHFANIEDTLNHSYAEAQLARFREALRVIRALGGRPSIIHAACTAATILFPETHFSMLRAGIGLYGLWPSRETSLSARESGRRMPELRPVLSWKTRVVQIKPLPAGSYIGYGCTYRTSRSTRLGVLPVGYADGYDRSLGNTAHVLLRGKRAPLLGRVCMNLVMIDLTDIPEAVLEDEVILLGRDGDETVTAEMMAEWAGTINYEVVTRISPLLPRVLTGED
jgi:alanine racemase